MSVIFGGMTQLAWGNPAESRKGENSLTSLSSLLRSPLPRRKWKPGNKGSQQADPLAQRAEWTRMESGSGEEKEIVLLQFAVLLFGAQSCIDISLSSESPSLTSFLLFIFFHFHYFSFLIFPTPTQVV